MTVIEFIKSHMPGFVQWWVLHVCPQSTFLFPARGCIQCQNTQMHATTCDPPG